MSRLLFLLYSNIISFPYWPIVVGSLKTVAFVELVKNPDWSDTLVFLIRLMCITRYIFRLVFRVAV